VLLDVIFLPISWRWGAVASSTRAPFRKHAVFEANPRRDSPSA
jgi:hypothetical protein